MIRADNISEHEDNEEDDESYEESDVDWSNIMFLPFHPVFQFVVLLAVLVKSILGPIQSVYPIVYCWNTMNTNMNLFYIKSFYLYGCDLIYGIDTFLRIMHRQVTDEAVRREFLPKSASLLFLDIMSLIPYMRLFSTESCVPVQFWPNILAFVECIPAYRVAGYFSLTSTHSYWNLSVGYTILLLICTHCCTCFLLLLTYLGLCDNCTTEVYKDWRKLVAYKLNETDETYAVYVYAASFILSIAVKKTFGEIFSTTYIEYIVFSILMISIFSVITFVVVPKATAEALLRVKPIYTFLLRTQFIVNETKRRNPSPKAYIQVKDFYTLTWNQYCGITNIPEVFHDLPIYLKVDIKQDFVWPIFYHSPTLRPTSISYRRWLCDFITLDYKLPGAKFFVGPQCQTHFYYIRSGIVQLISSDDGITPLLSVTSGTIFGDISFYLPPTTRKVIVRCLTYCEVFIITRADMLKSLHKFPYDRKIILQRVNEKIKHGRTLHTCKQHIRGLNRAEDEGIAWVKKRWWEISKLLSSLKNKPGNKNVFDYQLPSEETVYHCPKYIGQLVLCNDAMLHMKSLFATINFPLILVPNSHFGKVWQQLVKFTVFLVLIFYPPNITRPNIPAWFIFFQFWTDFIYASDICVSLLTLTESRETVRVNAASVILTRCKTLRFYVDVLSTIWTESLVTLIGKREYFYLVQFNRLIKIYILFSDWDIKKDPLTYVCLRVILINFSFLYISSYITYILVQYVPEIDFEYFFGDHLCTNDRKDSTPCIPEITHVFYIFLTWLLEHIFPGYVPHSLPELYTRVVLSYFMVLLTVYCQAFLIGVLYSENKDISNYQYFVINAIKHYKDYRIHPDLLKRLQRYLLCHWKYYKGRNVLFPKLMQNEPFDITWRVSGQVAENIIKNSRAFASSDPGLIRELAYHAQFLILPKGAVFIIFGVVCKNIAWVVQGNVKCEYHDAEGELQYYSYKPMDTLSFISVFFSKPSMKTFIAHTDCEILYIKMSDFEKIIKHYPKEKFYFDQCLEDFAPKFDKLIHDHLRRHRDYQDTLRMWIFHRISRADRKQKATIAHKRTTITSKLKMKLESLFMHYWMPFRAFIVCLSIASTAFQGGCGAMWRRPLIMIGTFCNIIGVIDIIVKLFMPFYDEHGIFISDTRSCMKHYMARGFIMDVIGALPLDEIILLLLPTTVPDDKALLYNTIGKFAHLYLVTGYFDYLADSPTANIALITILKWQVLSLLVMLLVSHYFINKCVDFTWDDKGNFINVTQINSCWLHEITGDIPERFQKIVAESLSNAQSGIIRFTSTLYTTQSEDIDESLVLMFLGSSFWFAMCYCITLLVLASRGNRLFQHGVHQLERFLLAERVEKTLIDNAVNHFKYEWLRTKGINMQKLMSERIGVVFRQDLNYFFFKPTLSALDTLLHGGEQLERELATSSTQLHFLPHQEIVREMDLAPSVFVVNRGRVIVKRDDKKLAVLTKGGIFGQLDGTKPRPVNMSAEADEYADILEIPIESFQEALDDECRNNIQKHATSKLDYMALKWTIPEDPYNSITFILGVKKCIKLPWMKKTIKAQDYSWYSYWLFTAWIVEPVITAVIVLMLKTWPERYMPMLDGVLVFLDVVHLMFFISEFFTMEQAVIEGKCVMRCVAYRYIFTWQCYTNVLTLALPLLTFITGNWTYQLFKIFRLRFFFDFYNHFCTGFQSKGGPLLLKILSLFLIMHGMVCGWILIACRDITLDNQGLNIPSKINATIDFNEWALPEERKEGCQRKTPFYLRDGNYTFSLLVPRYWWADYLVSMSHILVLFTHAEIDSVVPLTINEIYYIIFINSIIYLLKLWIFSLAISTLHTNLNELYKYDFAVNNLITYLKYAGLSSTLLKSVKEYMKHLWQRQRGDWLPELALKAPQCLREDILVALYIHHLKTPPLLRDLPHYFLRQLVTKLNRIVIFPGKVIVMAGDIFPAIYFIHEGEVEKWAVDKSGDRKLTALLSTNGYFGLIPGLFPNTPFQYTYTSRTVVDILHLHYNDWQNLLHAYPEIERQLYSGANHLKEFTHKH